MIITKLNESFLHVNVEIDVAMALREHFVFEVPGWRFTPKGKAGIWDGKIYLFDIVKRRLPLGLFKRLLKFAEDRSYTVSFGDSDYGFAHETSGFSISDATEYMTGLNLHSRGNPVEFHDYQAKAFHIGINEYRGIFLASVGAGKSMIIYSICRYITEELGGRVLIVVPTIALTTQMKGDFADYACMTDWSADDNCHLITAGVTKTTDKPIVISTFQSIYKQSPDWFNQFTCIFGDEGHKIQSATIASIFQSATNVKYKLSCTGTLHDAKCHVLTMEGLCGPVHEIALAKDLIDRGILSSLSITGLTLNWPEEICKAVKKVEYDDEIKYIISNQKRNKFIANLALSCKGVTLVLFRYIDEQGKPLFDLIKEKSGDRDVHYVAGSVNGEDREDIRQSVISNKSNDIIVASYGTYSTGVNLPNIENVILAHPMKSKITILQTIGRGLRLSEGKTGCKLFDISDNMTHKRKPNMTYLHYGERVKMYIREGFSIKSKSLEF